MATFPKVPRTNRQLLCLWQKTVFTSSQHASFEEAGRLMKNNVKVPSSEAASKVCEMFHDFVPFNGAD
jgi:hypothetical protein